MSTIVNGQELPDAPATATPPPAAPEQKGTHKPEAGEVGTTGEHGDLGSNAA